MSALDENLSEIAKTLMAQFSSKEGYKAFDDAIPTIQDLRDRQGIRTAVISNGDNRIRGWHLGLTHTRHSRQAGCRQGAARLEFSGLSSARCA